MLVLVLAWKVSATLPPPGIVKLDQAGEGAPTTGSEIVSPVAAPLPAALATLIVQVAGLPAATYCVLVDFVTVSCGKHAVELPAPGMLAALRLVIWNPPDDAV